MIEDIIYAIVLAPLVFTMWAMVGLMLYLFWKNIGL